MSFFSLLPWWGWILVIGVPALVIWRLTRRDRSAPDRNFYRHSDTLTTLLVVSPEWTTEVISRPARRRRLASCATVHVLESGDLRAVYEAAGLLESIVITLRGDEVTLSFYAGQLTSVELDGEMHDDVSSVIRNGRGRATRLLNAVRRSLGLDVHDGRDYEAELKEKKHHADEHREEVRGRLQGGKKKPRE